MAGIVEIDTLFNEIVVFIENDAFYCVREGVKTFKVIEHQYLWQE